MQSAWTLLSWGPQGWLDDIGYGVFVTASLAVATLPVGLAIGFFVALAKQSPEPSLRIAGNIYTTIFRGLPELLTLFLVFYGAQIGLQKLIHLVDPEATVEVNSFVSGMVALGVVFSSYASEVFLSAFKAVPLGQYEGGYSIGLSKGQTMRLVVLPQLIRIALPGLADPDENTEAVTSTRAVLRDALARDLPVLGICLGAELLAEAAGARTRRCEPEFGFHPLTLAPYTFFWLELQAPSTPAR